MKLVIKNFAKIKDADIALNGITVIAGENNSGKSTVGKVLGAVFHSFLCLDKVIYEHRLKNMASYFLKSLEFYGNDKNLYRGLPVRRGNLEKEYVISRLEYCDISSITSVMEVFEEIARERYSIDLKLDMDMYYKLYNKISDSIQLPDAEIISRNIEQVFVDIFYGQCNSLLNYDKAEVSLEIQKKTNEIVFADNRCVGFSNGISLRHEVIYINNPYIIDVERGLRDDNSLLAKKLWQKLQKRDGDLVDTLIRENQWSDIGKSLDAIIPGELFIDERGTMMLQSTKYRKALKVRNLSSGVKAFAIIKRLLENGSIEENGVIVFDEPEIHVHPEWQLLFAELLVLLQKKFDLTILLTTHSPYFINALEVYAYKHGVTEKMNTYLSVVSEDGILFRNVTEHTDEAYVPLAEPFNKLEELRRILEMED